MWLIVKSDWSDREKKKMKRAIAILEIDILSSQLVRGDDCRFFVAMTSINEQHNFAWVTTAALCPANHCTGVLCLIISINFLMTAT